MVDRFPRAERARGFLEGVALAAHWQTAEDDLAAEPLEAPGDELVQ